MSDTGTAIIVGVGLGSPNVAVFNAGAFVRNSIAGASGVWVDSM